MMFYLPWSPSIRISRHDQAAIPEIFAQPFPAYHLRIILPRQPRFKFRILMESLSRAMRMCDKSSLITSNTVFPKPLAEKVLSSIEVPMEASQVLTQGSLNAILIKRLIFVVSITMRSLPFLLSLLELLPDLNGGISLLKCTSTHIIRSKKGQFIIPFNWNLLLMVTS
jgi:hypothetical protein